MPTAKRFNFNIEDIPSYFDCDGLTKNALVLPATVRGIIDYLDDCGFDYAGKTAIVLGRSDIVGKPMAKALLDRNMTVSICHSKTNYGDKEYLLHNADLVICATSLFIESNANLLLLSMSGLVNSMVKLLEISQRMKIILSEKLGLLQFPAVGVDEKLL